MNKIYSTLNLKKFIKLGLHLGHHKKKQNPLMSNFIIGNRSNINILNLNITLQNLHKILPIIIDLISKNNTILLISNNHYYKKNLTNAFSIHKQPTTIGPWIPGTLTNLKQIKKYIPRILNTTYLNINKLNRLPNIILLLNYNSSNNFIIKEAKKLKIPVISVADTNNLNPRNFFQIIPSNDNSNSINTFFTNIFKKAILIGYAKHLLTFKNKKLPRLDLNQ